MTPYAEETLRALLKKHLDDSIENCGMAVSLGAWTPTGIGEDVEDFTLTDDHFKEWLMLEMKDIVEQHLEEKDGICSNQNG